MVQAWVMVMPGLLYLSCAPVELLELKRVVNTEIQSSDRISGGACDMSDVEKYMLLALILDLDLGEEEGTCVP